MYKVGVYMGVITIYQDDEVIHLSGKEWRRLSQEVEKQFHTQIGRARQ